MKVSRVTMPSAANNSGTSHHPATPGQHASPSAEAKAYGKNCKDQSKKHLEGKLATNKTDSPRAACQTESKNHVKGENGTAFSRCVSDGAKLLKDQKAQEQSATPESSPPPSSTLASQRGSVTGTPS